jgi:histidinol-phosphatase (PHP family)
MTGFNYHTHSHFSDGGKPPQEYVEEAIRQGMTGLGFSDHAPIPFENPFSLPPGRLGAYCEEIRRLQADFADKLNIFLGLEIDFVPGIIDNFHELIEQGGLDYSIGSIHLVGRDSVENLWFIDDPKIETFDYGVQTFFGGDIRKALRAFYDQTNQMITSQTFDVIGHLDKVKMHCQNRYFSEDEPWYEAMVFETLDLVRQKGLIVEVNTRGAYKKSAGALYPSAFILRRMNELNIPVIISSDAHQPEELQLMFDKALAALQQAGYRDIMRLTKEGWQETRPAPKV